MQEAIKIILDRIEFQKEWRDTRGHNDTEGVTHRQLFNDDVANKCKWDVWFEGYIVGLENIVSHLQAIIKEDESINAETLKDKLRDEHRPIPEERENANLFETMAEKFRPKI